MHADIGAAVDRHNAVAVQAPARRDQLQRELDLDRIEGARLHELEIDANAGIRAGLAVVEAVEDYAAVIGGGEYEGEFASDIAYGVLLGRDARRAERERINCQYKP